MQVLFVVVVYLVVVGWCYENINGSTWLTVRLTSSFLISGQGQSSVETIPRWTVRSSQKCQYHTWLLSRKADFLAQCMRTQLGSGFGPKSNCMWCFLQKCFFLIGGCIGLLWSNVLQEMLFLWSLTALQLGLGLMEFDTNSDDTELPLCFF